MTAIEAKSERVVPPRVMFWLPKPMNVYTPILRTLAEGGQVSLGVVYFGKHRKDCFDDGETGTRAVFDESLLEGYPSKWQADSLLSGFVAGWRGVRPGGGFGVLAGTQHRFSRGVLLGSFIRRSPVVIRYDATLRERFGSKTRDFARRLLLKRIFRRAFRLAYTSEETRAYLKHYGAKDAQLIHFPYVVDVEAVWSSARRGLSVASSLRAALGVPPNAVIVLGAIKFTKREAPLELVEALGRTKSGSLHLLLAGDGPLREEVDARIREVCPGRVTRLGFVPYARLLQMYGLADIFVHPARTEVWGVSVNEAMVAGVPVIASDGVGAGRELIRHGENGFLYQAGDVSALAALLDTLGSSKEVRLDVGRAGKATIEALSPEKCAMMLADLALACSADTGERDV